MKDRARVNVTNLLMHASTVLSLLTIIVFLIYGYQLGVFTSVEAFSDYIRGFGMWAPILFIAIQIIQVIIPILPGAIACIAGVIIFGPWIGLLYNYIGICVGSIIVFMLAKRYGRRLVRGITGEKAYKKYIGWLSNGKKFDKMFSFAIFFPIAPDDVLCYIAGLTKMNWKKFVMIILLGKPMSIAIYSLGMTSVIQYLLAFLK